jgi:hypothetical protein
MAIREPHVSIGHRHQPLKSSQLPIPLRHVAIRWRHQPINCPHRTIRFRHLSREWLHSGLKISTVTAGDSRPRFCLSTAPAAQVPGQPHISLRSFRLDAANRTLHKADEDTDLLQPSKRRRASLHRRRKRFLAGRSSDRVPVAADPSGSRHLPPPTEHVAPSAPALTMTSALPAPRVARACPASVARPRRRDSRCDRITPERASHGLA